MQIWDDAGITTYRFNPVMTYPNQADKFINNYASGSGEMMDEGGNYYYTSHPPFAYYLPFFVFKILGIQSNVLPVQVFNLLVHFLCGVGMFLILLQLLPSESNRINISAITGFTACMFTPATLWFHSNVYMADILVQLFFIYGVHFSLKFSEAKNKNWLPLLALASFLMTYTSWLGVFFCVTVIAVGILKGDFKQSALVLICTAAALMLTAFQYSQIAGWDALRQEWLVRFTERSGWISGHAISGVIVIFKNYITSYLPLIAALVVLLIFHFKQFKHFSDRRFALFALLAFIPVLLMHVILPNYSGHDFTTLYGGLFLCVIFGMFIQLASKEIGIKWIAAGIIVLSILCLCQYYYINRPGEFSIKGDRYADFQDIGKSVAAQSSRDETIFLIGLKPSPEIIFYAGRNIKQVKDKMEAMDFLKKNDKAKGVVFDAINGTNISLQERITIGE